MTRGSVEEYAKAVRERYQRASRKEKKRILDEFTRVSGYHRACLVRLLERNQVGLSDTFRGTQSPDRIGATDRPLGELVERKAVIRLLARERSRPGGGWWVACRIAYGYDE